MKVIEKNTNVLLDGMGVNNLLVLAMSVYIYVSAVAYFQPAFLDQAGAWIYHAILLMAILTVFYGVSDIGTYTYLMVSLKRSGPRLMSIDLGTDTGIIKTASGGLYAAALSRMDKIGDRSPTCFEECVMERFHAASHGTWVLSFAVFAAMPFGMLGTILGLKQVFLVEPVDGVANGNIVEMLPYLGLAMQTTILGLIISLFAAGIKIYAGSLLERECFVSLLPTIRSLGKKIDDKSDLKPFSASGWSLKFQVARVVIFLLSAIVAVLAIIALLGVVMNAPATQDERSQSHVREDESGIVIEALPMENKVSFKPKTSVNDVVKTRVLAAERGDVQVDNGYIRVREALSEYHAGGVSDITSMAKVDGDDPVTAGIVHLTDPRSLEPLLDQAYPRLLALYDWQYDSTGKAINGTVFVTFFYDQEHVATVPLARFEPYLAKKGFDRSMYGFLDRTVLESSFPREKLRQMKAQQEKEWQMRAKCMGGHRVVWALFESKEKIAAVLEQCGEKNVEKDRPRDYLAVTWSTNSTGRLIVKSVNYMAPRQLKEYFAD